MKSLIKINVNKKNKIYLKNQNTNSDTISFFWDEFMLGVIATSRNKKLTKKSKINKKSKI